MKVSLRFFCPVICGFTNGIPNATAVTYSGRRALVARFEYLQMNVSTRVPNFVQTGEIVNISFRSLPLNATSAIPIVQLNGQPCQAVQWIGPVLSATIPPGTGGPFELSVEFNYLPHFPSATIQNITYVPTPSLLDIQPRQGPAAGYNILVHTANIITDVSSVIIFVGGIACIDVGRLNSSRLTCLTPPGTGRNISVLLSITGLVNSTETIDISYDPPAIAQVSPSLIPTSGGLIWIKGSNFGPCLSSPCNFLNISIVIGNFGTYTNGIHYNDTDLQCNAPEGFDAGNVVTITVNGQSNSSAIGSFGKPAISSISPSASISKNPTIILEGSNFGNLSAPRVVIFRDAATLQNYTCPNVSWISHQAVRCQFTTVDLPSTATLDVTIITGSQASGYSGNSLFRTGIINNPPVASPLNVSILEEQSIILEFQSSDSDADDSATIHITEKPVNGTLYQLSSSGERGALIDTVSGSIVVSHPMFRVLYIPHLDFNGNDSISFKARDTWNADSTIEIANISVAAVPDPPLPVNRTYQMDEDTEVSFTLETIDPDSTILEQTGIVLSLPTNGVFFIHSFSNATLWDQITIVPAFFPRNTTVKYSPLPNFYGTDSFNFIANDGYHNSTVNGTILLNVRPVNDPPFLSITGLNLTVYEDTEAVFTFDVSDIDNGDKVTVKLTNLDVAGTMYFMDIQKGAKVLLGEGSEIKGPPYQFFYVPPIDYYTRTNQSIQRFNITYSDGVTTELLTHQVSFPVLAVNDPPRISCSAPEIILPTSFITGISSNLAIQIQASDVDNTNLTFILTSAPLKGVLKTSDGQRLGAESSFNDSQLIFDAEQSGGGYPYSNFTIYAIDSENATSNHCLYYFTFKCPPGLFNNIFSNGTGEICAPCRQGAVCSADGSTSPLPQYGWWKSNDNNTFLPCFPMDACLGTAENACGVGYEGIRCAQCQQNYYRLGSACRECRVTNILPNIITFVIFCIIAIFFYYLQRMRVYRFGFALVNILINFLQTIWILRKVRLDWPPELLRIIDYFSIFNLNVEFVSPECIIQTPLDFSQKLRMILALPIILLIATLLVIVLFTSLKAVRNFMKPKRRDSNVEILTLRGNQPADSTSFGLIMMKMFNASLSILYVHLAAKSLALFDCSFEEDGKAYLDDEVSLICYTDWWYQDLSFGIASIFIYIIGVPVYFGILCLLYYQTKFRGGRWENWKHIARGILHGDGDFKPEYQHFIILQLFQKLAVVAISLFFSRYTGLQIVLTIISLLVSHMTYSKYNPYVHQSLNTLEKMSVICSILVLAFGLPFKIDDFRNGQYRNGLVFIILSVVFGFILAVLGAVVNDVRKSIIRNGTLSRKSGAKNQQLT